MADTKTERRYFRRRWDESRGLDSHDDWGLSWWYFEVAEDGTVTRQIEKYDTGPTKRYSESQQFDADGMLSDQPLDLGEFEPFEITRCEFESVWNGESGSSTLSA